MNDVLEKEQINTRQFFIMVFLVTTSNLALVLPPMTAAEAQQDAWMSILIGIALGLVVVLLLSTVAKHLPQTTLIESLNHVFGRWIGVIISIVFLIFVLLSLAVYLQEISGFMVLHMLQETPIQIIHIVFLSLLVMAVRLGIRSFSRLAELFFMWFIIIFILFVCLVAPEIDFDFYKPILEHGFKPVLRGALPAVAFPYTELVIFLMIVPNISQVKRMRKPMIVGALLGGVVIFVLTYLCVLVLGSEIMVRNTYPVYSLARMINIGEVLQRVEVGFTSIWIISTFIKMALYFYALNIGIAQLLKLHDFRTLTLPNMPIISTLALIMAPSIVKLKLMITKYWPFYDLTIGVLLPLLLLIVYALRKRLVR